MKSVYVFTVACLLAVSLIVSSCSNDASSLEVEKEVFTESLIDQEIYQNYIHASVEAVILFGEHATSLTTEERASLQQKLASLRVNQQGLVPQELGVFIGMEQADEYRKLIEKRQANLKLIVEELQANGHNEEEIQELFIHALQNTDIDAITGTANQRTTSSCATSQMICHRNARSEYLDNTHICSIINYLSPVDALICEAIALYNYGDDLDDCQQNYDDCIINESN